jgi:hypothetical protein
MKRILQKILLSMILTGGLFIGMIRGQEIRQKWIAKMKNRYEEKQAKGHLNTANPEEVSLDEFEISAYHS